MFFLVAIWGWKGIEAGAGGGNPGDPDGAEMRIRGCDIRPQGGLGLSMRSADQSEWLKSLVVKERTGRR
jgi:hypothetical protein